MRFGGKSLPLPMRVGRMVVYFQCGMLGLAALFAVGATALSGPDSGLALSGLLLRPGRIVTGGGVFAFAIFHFAVVMVLLLLAGEATRATGIGRTGLIALEALLALYFVGFLSADWSSWIFGPGLCAAAIAAYNWPALMALVHPGAAAAAAAPADGEDRTDAAQLAAAIAAGSPLPRPAATDPQIETPVAPAVARSRPATAETPTAL